MTEAGATNTALLVQVLEQLGDLREQVGGVNSQLEHGSRRFDDIDKKVSDIGTKQTAIETKITPLLGIDKRVKAIETFMGKKLAPLVAVASTVIAIIIWIVVALGGAALTWFKTSIQTHLHWS